MEGEKEREREREVHGYGRAEVGEMGDDDGREVCEVREKVDNRVNHYLVEFCGLHQSSMRERERESIQREETEKAKSTHCLVSICSVLFLLSSTSKKKGSDSFPNIFCFLISFPILLSYTKLLSRLHLPLVNPIQLREPHMHFPFAFVFCDRVLHQVFFL
jgi:hypothetical protein